MVVKSPYLSVAAGWKNSSLTCCQSARGSVSTALKRTVWSVVRTVSRNCRKRWEKSTAFSKSTRHAIFRSTVSYVIIWLCKYLNGKKVASFWGKFRRRENGRKENPPGNFLGKWPMSWIRRTVVPTTLSNLSCEPKTESTLNVRGRHLLNDSMKRSLLAEVHELLTQPRKITLPISNSIARDKTTKTLTAIQLL